MRACLLLFRFLFAFLLVFLFVFISVGCACGVSAAAAAVNRFVFIFARPTTVIELLHEKHSPGDLGKKHIFREPKRQIPQPNSHWRMIQFKLHTIYFPRKCRNDSSETTEDVAIVRDDFDTFSLEIGSVKNDIEYFSVQSCDDGDINKHQTTRDNASHMRNVCDNCSSHSNGNGNSETIFMRFCIASAGSGRNEQRRMWNDMQSFGVALPPETQQHCSTAASSTCLFLFLDILCLNRSILTLVGLRNVGIIILPRSLGSWLLLSLVNSSSFIFICGNEKRCCENVDDRYREEKQ